MRTIIIVEDEKDIREGLVQMLPWGELGFEVVRDFPDGNSAIRWLTDHHVHVVMTDIMMEHGSGLDLAKYLSENERMELIVFYSAYPDFRYAQLAIQYGVKRYITKDTGYHELIDIFREINRTLDETYHDNSVTRESENSHEDHVLFTLMRYLKTYYKMATLQQAAAVLHMNPNYLSTYIKKHSGQNFKDILTNIRMEKAYELLKETSYKPGEIQKMIGYSDERMFLRAFRKKYGMSPAQFRRQIRNST